MKNLLNKVMLLGIIVAIVVGGIVFQNRKSLAYPNSRIVPIGDSIFYNDYNMFLREVPIKGHRGAIIYKRLKLMGGDGKYICAKDNNKNVYIFNVKNTEKYKLSNIDAADMDIYNNKIYYANKSDGNKIYSICFNGKENIKVSDATTSHLRVTNNHIYFENNRDNIYSLSLLTKEIKNVYEGSNCYFFETDGKYIYLSDYQNDNTILKLDAHTFEEKGRINIRTVNFCIYNGSLCYIPFVDEDDIGDNYKDYSHIYNEEGQIIL